MNDSIMLQWGRGLSTPEIFGRAPILRSAISASMGPGSFDPGNLRIVQTMAASRSRFNGAGVFRPRKCPWPCQRVEMDHAGFNGAGVFRPRKWPSKSSARQSANRLQWGRGLSTPEIVLFSTD